jgi:predicted RNA-binding Zn-ribbon protein involved in translation (DUF1610 family)
VARRRRGPPVANREDAVMPLCVYLCYTPGCNTKMDRWMPTAEEGAAAEFECPRCGVVMQCAWTGSQMKTPNLKDAGEFKNAKAR